MRRQGRLPLALGALAALAVLLAFALGGDDDGEAAGREARPAAVVSGEAPGPASAFRSTNWDATAPAEIALDDPPPSLDLVGERGTLPKGLQGAEIAVPVEDGR